MQAILGIEAVYFPFGIPLILVVVPNENVEAIGIEDDRALAVFFFQPISVTLSLLLSNLCVPGCLFRFDDSQGHVVIAPQDIVGVPLAGLGWLVGYFPLQRNCIRIVHVPADFS
ncbi:hypothetical protein DSECCO2_555170 [anaerobic digester metagenome]